MTEFCTYFPYLISLATGFIGFLVGWLITKNKISKLNNEMYNRRRVYLRQKDTLEKQEKQYQKIQVAFDDLTTEHDRAVAANRQLKEEFSNYKRNTKEKGLASIGELDKLTADHNFLQNRCRDAEKRARNLEAEKFKLNTKLEKIKLEIKQERARLEKELKEQQAKKEQALHQNLPLPKKKTTIENPRAIDANDRIINEPKTTTNKETERERLKALSKKIKSTLRDGKGEHRQDKVIPKEQYLPLEKRELKKLKKSYDKSLESFKKVKEEYLTAEAGNASEGTRKSLRKAMKTAEYDKEVKKAIYKAAQSYLEDI